ncbi:AAA family ATPase [Leptospirillum ferrooxidans]|uniref:Anticodon nuclease n=1 Tax=Leptospirillum ferrooxidans (strain C2-3) TaxID=1162668 RepID=I0IM40_LEPFC|nr:AAA family ATPase [Leptospirillum ferrooxidans]BAM06339.1 anticodon nuclease [Leptospirillum ferrooxidans C2-3]
MKESQPFNDLSALAKDLRQELEKKKIILLYAYNGTGKTRLSMAFKDLGKKTNDDDETIDRDTLYFNAFTEDLFQWDNDLDGDSDRQLVLNAASYFFAGLAELEMETRIRPLLERYADFDFSIDTEKWEVFFSRRVDGQILNNIKVSRGEENIFVWCFFLAIAQLAMDPEIEAYRWVKYLYIDDPISSLDEQNAIGVANHLAQLLKHENSHLKTVISTHHTLFFNVLSNELKNARKYFLQKPATSSNYILREETSDTPFFHHVAALTELYQAAQEDRLFTHHFNMLRVILEKTASFHGHKNFSACIKKQDDDQDGILHARLINILSHGNYSLYEPKQMLEENKQHFRKILYDFLNRYPFNPDFFPKASEETDTL